MVFLKNEGEQGPDRGTLRRESFQWGGPREGLIWTEGAANHPPRPDTSDPPQWEIPCGWGWPCPVTEESLCYTVAAGGLTWDASVRSCGHSGINHRPRSRLPEGCLGLVKEGSRFQTWSCKRSTSCGRSSLQHRWQASIPGGCGTDLSRVLNGNRVRSKSFYHVFFRFMFQMPLPFLL